MWLGGSDENQEGQWEWVSGEPFRFAKWFPGQPANDQGNADYLHIGVPWHKKPEDWNDTPVTYKQVTGFICEWDE